MLNTKDLKNINILSRYLEKQHNFSDGKFPYNYLIGAMLSYKNKRSFGINNYVKTHPITIQPNNVRYIVTIHAEVAAINNWNNNWNITESSLYVIGLTKSGNFTYSSKPCNQCMKLIKNIGVKRIIYFNFSNNNLEFIEHVI